LILFIHTTIIGIINKKWPCDILALCCNLLSIVLMTMHMRGPMSRSKCYGPCTL